jgi:hypothetical protein
MVIVDHRGRVVYTQWPWVQAMSWILLIAAVALPGIASAPLSTVPVIFAGFAWLLTSAVLVVIEVHIRYILAQEFPLTRKVKRKIRWLWTTPFYILWAFVSLGFLEVVGLFHFSWTLLLPVSYLFSIVFSSWLYFAKPAYAAMAAVLSFFWCLAQCTMGEWFPLSFRCTAFVCNTKSLTWGPGYPG